MTSKELARQLSAAGHAIAPDTVRKAWGQGAPRNSATAFLRWHAARAKRSADPDLQDSKKRKIDLEIEILEQRLVAETRDNQIRAGELVERSKVRADITKAASKAVAILQQKFETELPPKQDGLPAEKIAEMNRVALLEVRNILSQPGAYESAGGAVVAEAAANEQPKEASQ